MTTANEIIRDALRDLGVLDIGEAAPPEYAADAISVLNQMLHGWKAMGVDITHTDLATSDDLTTGPEYDEPIYVLLAQRLAPRYSVAYDPVRARMAWDTIYAGLAADVEGKVDEGLTRMPSQYWYGYEVQG